MIKSFIYFCTLDTCTVKFLKSSTSAIRVRNKVTKILEIHFWTITQQQNHGEWIDLTTQASKDLFTLSKSWRTVLVRKSQFAAYFWSFFYFYELTLFNNRDVTNLRQTYVIKLSEKYKSYNLPQTLIDLYKMLSLRYKWTPGVEF